MPKETPHEQGLQIQHKVLLTVDQEDTTLAFVPGLHKRRNLHHQVHLNKSVNHQSVSKGSKPSVVTLYVDTKTPVLLQTATTGVLRPDSSSPVIQARMILDSGSQRSYITNRLKTALSLPTEQVDKMLIKFFGSVLWRCKGRLSEADIAEFAKYPILLDANHHITALIGRVVMRKYCMVG